MAGDHFPMGKGPEVLREISNKASLRHRIGGRSLMTWNRTCFLVMSGALLSNFAQAEISFNRDIRPIMSDTCFRCHGPDKNARIWQTCDWIFARRP